jgi:hypothetical protein
MTLPQDIQKAIDDRELELTEKMPLTNDQQTGYYQGFSKGYQAGATECAGKAQGLVDALQELVNLKRIKDQFGKTDEYLNNQPLAWETAANALAKYKEATQ